MYIELSRSTRVSHGARWYHMVSLTCVSGRASRGNSLEYVHVDH